MSTKHTPTPWFVMKEVGPCQERLISGKPFYPDHGDPLFHVTVTGNSDEEREANTDFVIRAVNSHDALLAALKGLMADLSGGKKHCGHDFTCICAGDAARAAIVAAEAN